MSREPKLHVSLYLVRSKYSGGLAMIVFEEPTELLSALDRRVMDEILARLEDTPLVHRQVASYLDHPRLSRMRRDAGNVDLASVELDKNRT